MAIDELLLGVREDFCFSVVRRHVHDKRGNTGEKIWEGDTETGSLSPLAFYFSFPLFPFFLL
jgi:outer membrane protein assembly factor BamB